MVFISGGDVISSWNPEPTDDNQGRIDNLGSVVYDSHVSTMFLQLSKYLD